ncbi:MAG: hypothetical protein HOP27_04865 [Anaerolineales bacterium]|nr:hypothetical protein [Anaerolineales bacterium]
MTTLYRILIILVVATIIGGAIYMAVGGGSSVGQQSAPIRSRDQPRPEGGEGREEGELPFGILKSLVIMSVASGVYLAGNKLFSNKPKPVFA